MTRADPTIRPERPEDVAAIAALITAAFAGAAHSDGSEAAIVARLREAGALAVSLVAEDGGAPVGHAAFSPVRAGDAGSGWYGLGPLAVLPARQGRGIGSALVRAGLARLRDRGAGGCVVFGDPAYYRRFGFVADPMLTYAGGPADHFMRIVLAGPAPWGTVAYHPAFS